MSGSAARRASACRPVPGQDHRRFGPAVILSLVLHAAVLAWLADLPRPEPAPRQAPLAVTLERQSASAPVDVAAPEPSPELVAEGAPVPPPRPAGSVPDPVVSEPELVETPIADGALLRARVLDRARTLVRTQASRAPEHPPPGLALVPDPGPGEPYAPVPALPGRPGWLNARVGPVQARAEAWREPDGELRGRRVLASGQVICSRRPVTGNDQFMHPWRDPGVVLSWLCGSERPAPPNRADVRDRPLIGPASGPG